MSKDSNEVKFTLPNGIRWSVKAGTENADMLAASVQRVMDEIKEKTKN